MKNANVKIVIVNWNGRRFLEDCLDSLGKLSYPNFDVVLVDNGSADDSVKFVESNYTDVIILRNNENLGFAEGNNVGIRYALDNNAEYILLLNNDTVVEADFLIKLVEVAETDEKIGLVGSMVYFMDPPDKICYAGGRRKWTTEWKHIGLEEKDRGQYNQTTETDFVYGCVLMITRKAVEQIGLLDKDYFTYVEEIDWNFRAKKAGFKLVFVPSSKVFHKIAASDESGRSSPIRHYYIIRNNLLFLKKHGNTSDILKFTAFILPKWILKNSIYFFSRPLVFKATLKAFRDFFRGRVGRAEF